ncbi:MAG: hypothetical protein HKP41_03655 [Desulfobacterales bacterium]|nr:hypothetical protein [Deltaproteobacteria bacterium]NNK93427.1 hypothetical protein [Desulfobacterales bacterium]
MKQDIATHATRPWLGQIAFDILVDDYANIRSLFTTTTTNHWHRTMGAFLKEPNPDIQH